MPSSSPSHTIATERLPLETVDVAALLIDDPDLLAKYNEDPYTDLRGRATLLARPASEVEVAALLAWASARRVAVTVVGARTGLVGGATPAAGEKVPSGNQDNSPQSYTESTEQNRALSVPHSLSGSSLTDPEKSPSGGSNSIKGAVLALSTEKLTRLDLDAEGRLAVCGPGVLQGDLWRAAAAAKGPLAPNGLLYPPDPTSRDEASLGGGVACNASGARTFKYGPTREWVTGLRVVLANGEALALRRGEVAFGADDKLTIETGAGSVVLRRPAYLTPEGKHAAGYFSRPNMDLVDLFIGEEGTLGVVTEVEVRLTEQPAGRFQLLAGFGSRESAINFVGAARKLPRRERPAALEWLDGAALALLRAEASQHALLRAEGIGAAVVVEAELPEATEEALDELLEAWAARLDPFAPLEVLAATTAAQIERFRQMRHAVPATVNEVAARRGLFKLGTDARVPFHRLADYLNWVRSTLEKESLEAVGYGHVGDGHIHFNLLPADESQAVGARRLYYELAARAVKLGGTVSAEHGIGKVKRGLLVKQVGSTGVKQMRELKLALDPKGILGPHNLFEA